MFGNGQTDTHDNYHNPRAPRVNYRSVYCSLPVPDSVGVSCGILDVAGLLCHLSGHRRSWLLLPSPHSVLHQQSEGCLPHQPHQRKSRRRVQTCLGIKNEYFYENDFYYLLPFSGPFFVTMDIMCNLLCWNWIIRLAQVKSHLMLCVHEVSNPVKTSS